MKSEKILEKVVVRNIQIGILLEKRRLVLEEIDAIDRRAKSFPRKPRARLSPVASLDEEADRLEIQIRELEETVKKDRVLLMEHFS